MRSATPSRRQDLVGQIVLVTAAAVMYFLVRGLREGSTERALENARWLLRLEARLGVDLERDVQRLASTHEWVVTASNWVYIWGHWPVIIGTLYVLHRWRPDDFTLLRNALFVSGAIGLAFYVSIPMAPPRLLDAGYRDTVTELSSSYRVLQPPALVNQYAAMPSLHAGWNLLAGAALYRASRRWSVRSVAVVGPIAMAVAVVSTGNHFVLDVVVGELVALVGWLAALTWAARRARGGGAPVGVADQVAALPEFDTVSAVRWGNARIGGDTNDFAGTDLTALTGLLDIDVVAGDPAAGADETHIVISRDAADEHGVEVGDRLAVEFAAAGTQMLTIGAIYDNEFLIGHYVIDLSAWQAYFNEQNDNVISARLAPDVTLDEAAAALAPIEDAFPQLQFETQAAWTDRLEGQLDNLLVIINVFLGLAIVIALLGITNTMALSVLERTREIGLMRAIGMTRGQTRGMIRLEAAVVSLFGALLGVIVGLAFGWVAVLAIPESIINRLSIPTVTLVVYVIVATIAGLVAASFPARRAARLDVLDAIAHQ